MSGNMLLYGWVYSISSEIYKTNIETLADASWIYNLRPVNFDWKDPTRAQKEGRMLGLILAGVYAANPQLVQLDSDSQPQAVNYALLAVPMLTEMQKLKQRVDTIEAQLKQNPTAA